MRETVDGLGPRNSTVLTIKHMFERLEQKSARKSSTLVKSDQCASEITKHEITSKKSLFLGQDKHTELRPSESGLSAEGSYSSPVLRVLDHQLSENTTIDSKVLEKECVSRLSQNQPPFESLKTAEKFRPN